MHQNFQKGDLVLVTSKGKPKYLLRVERVTDDYLAGQCQFIEYHLKHEYDEEAYDEFYAAICLETFECLKMSV